MAEVFRSWLADPEKLRSLSPWELKAARAIARCRTAELGGHAGLCDACGHVEIAYNSCRNRHCPKCQAAAQAEWIEGRLERVLPVTYFHVVFTLPGEIAALARGAPGALYDLLFASASATLLELGRDPKRLGAQLGATLVLHTWTRDLRLHPHVHCVVTGGGLSEDGSRWVQAKGGGKYLFPVKVLSRLYRGKFLALLKAAFAAGKLGLDPGQPLVRSRFDALIEPLYKREWVVYAKRPFAGPEQVFQYLGRYTHRVAISNQRLEALDSDTVTFHTKGGRKLTLDHDTFVRRFLLHVLPPGFVKIRHYGLMASSNATTRLEIARARLEEQGAAPRDAAQKAADDWREHYERLTDSEQTKCPRCKVGMLLCVELPPHFDLALLLALRSGKGPDP